MTPEEKQLVTGLFDRLRQADGQGKDPEAQALIGQAVAAQPSSPYLLVQTLLVQEHALANAQARIATLERQLQDAAAAGGASPARSGGFLGSLFGSGTAQPAAPQAYPPQGYPPQQGYPQQGYAPQQPSYPSTIGMAPSGGSGFLGSAVRTAAGVAGGALLFEGISSLLSHNAGPFSGGLGGGGGFLGGGQAPAEIVNNYYEAPAAQPGGGGYDPGAGAGDAGSTGGDTGYAPDDSSDPGAHSPDDTTQV